MDTSGLKVAPLDSGDAPAYNAFFRSGTIAHPDTLRISPADIDAAPFKVVHPNGGATLLARDASGNWLGVVTVERETGREKRQHIAWVLRMYVPTGNAGRGTGRALLRAAIAAARQLPGIDKLNLTVAAHNVRAVSLYESEGFRTFASETDAFRDCESRTELSMTLDLRSGQA
jgi:GNAT superfamily N-acetyltransferase